MRNVAAGIHVGSCKENAVQLGASEKKILLLPTMVIEGASTKLPIYPEVREELGNLFAVQGRLGGGEDTLSQGLI